MIKLRATLTDQVTLLRWAADHVLGHRAEGWEWPDDSKAMGVLDSETGRIVAVFVINTFTDDSCEAHIASDGRRKWATYGVLRAIFHYIFVALGVRRVIASTPTENVAAIKMMQQMGFTIEGTIRTAPDGSQTNTVGQMFNTECKFIADLMGADHG